MEYPEKLQAQFKSHFRERASIARKAEREVQKSCEKYHDWCDKQKNLNNKPLTILAEGDSWFKYVIGKAVIFQLEKLLRVNIQNLASPGDEVSEMLNPTHLERLAVLLKRGPTKGWKYDCMLFSGGGNDLVGRDRFHKWIHPYKRGMTARQLLNQKAIDGALSILEESFLELIAIRDANSPKTHLFLHGYDFVIPDGRRACWLGPWMLPGLVFRKVPKSKRKELVQLFLEQFDKRLDNIAKKHQRVTIVQTQGTLSEKDWANELHPTNSGFRKIAKVFKSEIRSVLAVPI